MSAETHRVLIGSLGWQHPAWEDDFYPEDLPVDWQLGYYANEFPLAVVTARELADSEALIEQIEECQEQLRILFALSLDRDPSAAGFKQMCELAGQLGERCIGILVQLNPADWDTARLAQHVMECDPVVPLCIEAKQQPLTPEWRDWLRAREIGWSWNALDDRDGLAVGRFAVINGTDATDPRSLRERLEVALQQGQGQRPVALLFEGEPPSVTRMRQAKTIEELL